MNIRFEFEGKEYSVGMDAYNKGLPIVLPDNTVVSCDQWLESWPPQPYDLKRINTLQLGSSPEETAKIFKGIVAKEITK